MSGTPPVSLLLSPSPGFAAAIVAAHGAAAACLWLLLPGAWGAALAALACALGAAAAWDRALLAAAGSVRRVELSGPDAAVLVLRDGRRVPSAVGGGRLVSRFCVIVPVRAPLRRSLAVTRGMLEPEPFRIFRLWALWGRTPRVAPGQLPA